MAFRFPTELEIHHVFDHLIVCLNQRREVLLTAHRDTHDIPIPIAGTRKEELFGLKTETEALLNELGELQERILAELEQKLDELVEDDEPVVPRYEDMQPIVAVGRKGHAAGELYQPCGVAIDENTNLIYVVEGPGTCRFSIFSETGKFIDTFTSPDMREPCSIAIHRDNLYVTDTGVHAVFQFKIESDMRFVHKLGSKGSGMGLFNCPLGLTVSTNGNVFVADCNNNRIKVLNDSLHFKRLITHPTMHYPNDVKLTPDEVYVLSDTGILVLSYTGDRIRSFSTQSYASSYIIPSIYFILDARHNIVVREWHNDNIRVLSREGTFLYTIQQPEGIGGLSGLALTNNLKIVTVYSGASNQLIIFSN